MRFGGENKESHHCNPSVKAISPNFGFGSILIQF